ncbi:sodium:solute symporter [Pollutibacter soli]|uniref:sodium:solute symporter n=1 Tax=Pollutibacter soli TaxID=3034157 RepID=UPI0030140611
MSKLSAIDIVIVMLYLAAMMVVGIYFSRKRRTSDQFTKASGKIPAWAIGLSIYATFLSSNTFIGVPGKAFGGNWNAFVFSLSLPLAGWVATKYFVPFYRKVGGVSAYSHLEHRFGAWARTYAVVCFLLTQLARMGSIFFGIALALQALTGFSMASIMLVTGICIVFYTVLGGIEAVIWTEVVQAIVKTAGAIVIIMLVISDISGGFSSVIKIGLRDSKFNLGGFDPDFTQSTFWVVLLYGFFMNLNNFGMDQNYVQRYHTAGSTREASTSVWMSVWMYVPISFIFFLIGTCLYAYYQINPDAIHMVRMQVASEKLGNHATALQVTKLAFALKPADLGDKIIPHFIVTKIPSGLMGIIIAAILSAAMSTISSGMNASATVFTIDIYKRYFNHKLTDKTQLKILYISTVCFGLAGMSVGISMIGVKSLLDTWWQLSGVFAGGVLGLFLLGMISRSAGNFAAITATCIGILVILWITLSPMLPQNSVIPVSALHTNMAVIIGTLTIFLVGILLSSFQKSKIKNTAQAVSDI